MTRHMISLRLPGHLIEALDRAAERLGTNRTQLIIQAVTEFLERLKTTENPA